MKVLYALIALLLVGDGLALRVIGDDATPTRWDPRLADLARFVEEARGLRFDHPVKVRFLAAKQYEAKARRDAGDLTDKDKREIADQEAELRALGLLRKGVSLFDDTNTLTSGGTLAFYDPTTDAMVVRGTALSLGIKVTLVHELTHALQDQQFNLDRSFDSDTQQEVFHALGEGDAVRIERRYVDDLSDADRQAYFAEEDAARADATNAIADVSPFLTQYFGAAYDLGAPLTSVVVATDGERGLDALFRRPPRSDETLMDPFALLDDAKASRVAQPKLGAGERRIHGGDFGALRWYLVLANFVDDKTALQATDGWRGDAYVTFRKQNRICVRATFEGDTATDEQEMTAALQRWKAGFGSDAVTLRTGNAVGFESCEPTTAATPRPGADQSLALPAARYELVNQVLASGGTPVLARCAVPELVRRLSVAQLNPRTAAEAVPLQTLAPRVAVSCRRAGQV